MLESGIYSMICFDIHYLLGAVMRLFFILDSDIYEASGEQIQFGNLWLGHWDIRFFI